MAEQDIAALAERAIRIAEQVAGTQAAIVAQQARSKRTVRWLIVSVALDVTLSVAVLLLSFHQGGIQRQLHATQGAQAALIRQQHESQLAGCAQANTFRAGQLTVWHHVISISTAPPHETAAQKAARLARLAEFRVFVGRQYRQISCTRLYKQ
jgi:hypothetical protein